MLWRNRGEDFPEWGGRDLIGAGYELMMLARDGAVSADVRGWQVERIPRRPELVTLTVGGNDLFMAFGDGGAARAAVGGGGAEC